MDRGKEQEAWNGWLREVAVARDELLGTVPPLSAVRRSRLRGVLAREFPVDAALREAGERRDRLRSALPEIPLRVTVALRRSLTTTRPKWSGRFIHSGLVAACLVLGLGFLALRISSERSRQSATVRAETIQPGLPGPLASRHQFGLRISAAEIASLRSSFLAANRPVPNEEAKVSASLRLDLPVQALLGDDSIASIP